MIHTIKILAPNGSFGATSTDGRMFLQRRGIGQQLEYSNRQHHFFLVARTDGAFDLFLGENGCKVFTRDEGFQAVEAFIQKYTGEKLTFAKDVLAYAYASAGTNLEQTDVFFSPLRYEASTDTIRHVPSNYCVVAFNEGDFAQPILDVDRAAQFLQPAVSKALKTGFHDCDRKLGGEYCKRRLAWLAGSYHLESQEGEIVLAVLSRDMATPKRLVS